LKFAYFDLPHLHLLPSLEVTTFEFRWDLWHQKTKVSGLSYGTACAILSLAILIQYKHVTDAQTDRHTMQAYTVIA